MSLFQQRAKFGAAVVDLSKAARLAKKICHEAAVAPVYQWIHLLGYEPPKERAAYLNTLLGSYTAAKELCLNTKPGSYWVAPEDEQALRGLGAEMEKKRKALDVAIKKAGKL